MLRNPGIEIVLRRELDSLPLPPNEEWLPRNRRAGGAWSTAGVLAAGILLIVIAVVVGPAIREWREDQTQGNAARPTPRVLPTVVDGIGVSPLRNAVRNPTLGYNILLRANWRESARWQQVPPVSIEPTLIGRATYTARSIDQERETLGRYGALAKLPWDLTAEAWSSDGLNTLEWLRAYGGCVATCTVGSTRIKGVDFLTSVDAASGLHAFYVTRGDRVLAFSYIVGSAAEQPGGVTIDILDQAIQSIGLP